MISLECPDLLATSLYSDCLPHNIIPARQRYSAYGTGFHYLRYFFFFFAILWFRSAQFSPLYQVMKLLAAGVFNPNCTRQGQSWSHQLWCQILDKCNRFIKKYLFLLQHLPNLFELLTRRQHSMFWRIFVTSLAVAPPCWPPGFTAITDHPWVGYSPQSSAVPVRIPISFRSQAVQSVGGSGFSVGRAISFFLSRQLALHRSGKNSQNHKALLHTRQILGKVSLD